MIEVYTLSLLSILLLTSLSTGLTLPSLFRNGPILWQMSIALFFLLLTYLVGLLLVNLAYQRIRSRASMQESWMRDRVTQPGSSGSLAWPGHLILAILLLLGLSILVRRSVVNPIHLALLAMGCIVCLGTFVTSWRENRRPPAPARDLKLTPGPGFIDIEWAAPDDPRCAQNLLVRSLATFVPAYPGQGDVLYRGLLTTWRDEDVKPGKFYQYFVFTHDGQQRYRSTMGQTCAALPLPDPPADVTFVPERQAIRLSWKLVKPYNLQAVRIIRRVVDAREESDEKQIEVEPRESWRDGRLLSGTRYEYWVYTIDAGGQRSLPAKVQAATLVEPMKKFEARVIKRNQVELTWQLPTDIPDFQDVVVTRSQEGAIEEPEEIYIGLEDRHVDRGLDYEMSYSYAIQARYTPPIRSELKTVSVVTDGRPDGIEDVKVEEKRCSISLQWTLPEHESVRRVRLTRLEYSPANNDWVEHELLGERATQYIDERVEPGTYYTYLLYVQASDGHWSEPKRVDAQTLLPPPAVSEVKAARPDSGSPVTLTWRLPDDGTVIGTHVVRHRNRPPGSPMDGEVIHHGPGTQVVDESADINQFYYYALFAFDSREVYSSSVFKRVPTHPLITFWVYYVDLDKREEVRLPSGLTMGEVAGYLLSKQGLDLSAGDAWTATLEETGQMVAPRQSLRNVGIQPYQTIRLEHKGQATMAKSATDETSETAARSIPDDEKLTLWIRYPDLDNKREQVRLPANLRMRQIAANRLKRQGVNLKTVSAWEAVIEESGRVIKPDESLGDAGIQTGETVCLIFEGATERLDENEEDEVKNE
jgi:hypothetical protein